LGDMIERHLTVTNSKDNNNKLQYLIDEYNNNKEHATIKMTPLQATDPKNSNLFLFNTHKNENMISINLNLM